MRIAWRPLLANTAIDSQVLEACEAAVMSLGRLGASVEPMDDDLEPVEPSGSPTPAPCGMRAFAMPCRSGATG